MKLYATREEGAIIPNAFFVRCTGFVKPTWIVNIPTPWGMWRILIGQTKTSTGYKRYIAQELWTAKRKRNSDLFYHK